MNGPSSAASGSAAIVAPGGTVGVLGGGQLGRMLAVAAARLGLKTHIFAPTGDTPAFDVSAAQTEASYDDLDTVARFATACDVVTLEFENIPLATLDHAALSAPVRPGRRALEVSQDRVAEKQFLQDIGVATTAFHAVDTLADLEAALATTNGTGLLKTRRLGYDGKGQVRINARSEAPAAVEALAGAPAILEAIAPFARELSVIVARSPGGAVACFDPAENVHAAGILRTSTVPGSIGEAAAEAAKAVARRIVEALDYIGVMGVEFFEMSDGRLLVNEIAPRVHNSGHWTLEACAVSQFEQHIRAVCGWPLGDPSRHSDAVMTNLIGIEADDWSPVAAEPGAALHLYGKVESRPGRKMGHVTRISAPVLTD